ncbi:MAG TPA: hypothetical protein DEP53_20515 [Bacteroidetes bacterium]|nr:MAG: hypothetical protein A2X66_06420 [Ignavibacteria bacterium GWA2_54_16]HCA82120.1 hypothetical protein [Bacteroidota bacterium]
MSASKLFLHISLVLVSILVMALVISGCQKKEGEGAKPEVAQQAAASASMENLKTAYAGAAKNIDWYDKFSKQAQKENLGDISVLFKALARSEKVHADMFASLLKTKGVEVTAPAAEPLPVGKARQYLKRAASSEAVEQSVLATYEKVAIDEQFAEAAELFRRSRGADERHARLLSRAIEMETNFARLPYVMCPECGYIVGSDKMDSCLVCKLPKEKFQKI